MDKIQKVMPGQEAAAVTAEGQRGATRTRVQLAVSSLLGFMPRFELPLFCSFILP